MTSYQAILCKNINNDVTKEENSTKNFNHKGNDKLKIIQFENVNSDLDTQNYHEDFIISSINTNKYKVNFNNNNFIQNINTNFNVNSNICFELQKINKLIIKKAINFIKKIHDICLNTKINSYLFVDNGKRATLNKKLMTIGRKKGGDGHNSENRLLKKAGMYKCGVSKKWKPNNFNMLKKIYSKNNNITLINYESIRKLVLNLKLIIDQRCMRHRCFGYLDFNNPKQKKQHRDAINWSFLAIKKIHLDLETFYL